MARRDNPSVIDYREYNVRVDATIPREELVRHEKAIIEDEDEEVKIDKKTKVKKDAEEDEVTIIEEEKHKVDSKKGDKKSHKKKKEKSSWHEESLSLYSVVDESLPDIEIHSDEDLSNLVSASLIGFVATFTLALVLYRAFVANYMKSGNTICFDCQERLIGED